MDAFVGADITCAVLSSKLLENKGSSLLVDVGTNGEIALWHGGGLYVASTAAGPTFEGASISCGCGAVTGAVDQVRLVDGQLEAHTIGGAPAVGLSGSGFIDAVSALLARGDIDETGAMAEESVSICSPVILTQKDVRNVQLAKGAIAAGIRTMLHAVGISVDEIERLYIAGGFGSRLNIKNAAAVGLIPAELADQAQTIGNAALSGAAMLLLDTENIESAKQIAAASKTVILSGNPDFSAYFMAFMLF